MILTIRGTSGSGKTTLARRIMEHYGPREPHHVAGRRQPLYYRLPPREPTGRWLRVLGHYESPTGGADTIGDGLDFIYGLAEKGYEDGDSVLFEGLLVSSDANRFIDMWRRGLPVLLITLSTPLQDCYAGVNARRLAKHGPGHKVAVAAKGDATRSKHMATASIMRRLEALGAPGEWHDRESAYRRSCQFLRLTTPDKAMA